MRAKRKGLNPFKISIIYFLAFFLVLFHQADKLALWLDDQGEYGEAAASFLREAVIPHGPAQMKDFEDQLLAAWPDVSVGAKFASQDKAWPANEKRHVKVDSSFEAQDDPLPFTVESTPEAATASLITTPVPVPLSTHAPQQDERLITLPNFKKVLLLGDSMMLEGIGPPLQRLLKEQPGLEVSRDGRYGTGLCRLDVFDWLAYFDQMLLKYSPELIIITLGANDPQDIVEPGKKRVFFGSDDWNTMYGQRVQDLLKRAADKNASVFWLGLPIMGREAYGEKIANINKITQEACEATANCRFWDAWLSVADKDNKYTVYSTDAAGKHVRIRAKDSIHLTESGGEIMAEKFFTALKTWASFGAEENLLASSAPQEIAPAAGSLENEGLQEAVLEVVSFYSPARAKETAFYVARPKVSDEKIPLVFLLHGAWDNYQSWIKHGQKEILALAAKHNIMLIMPDGEPFGWYLNGRQTPIEAYLIDELLPYALKNYAVDKNRLGILGLSMGGHGAFTLALKHDGLFKAVGSMSGVMDITRHAGPAKIDQSLKLQDALGPYENNQALWQQNSAYWLTVNNPQRLKDVALIFSVGKSDKLVLKENQIYHQLLLDLGLQHQYDEVAGAHDWQFWLSQLPLQLEYFAQHLVK